VLPVFYTGNYTLLFKTPPKQNAQDIPIVSSRNDKLLSAGSTSTEMDMESMIKQMYSLNFSTSEGRKDMVRKPRNTFPYRV
jgi:hypothetical protein